MANECTRLARQRTPRPPRTPPIVINSMSVTGVVSLAGIMTRQILGGLPLAEAVKYQILVMFMQKNGTPRALSA